MHKKRKRGWIIGLCVVAAVLIAAGALVGNFFYNFALLPRRGDAKSPAVEAASGGEDAPIPDDVNSMFVYDESWPASVGCEEAALISRDGLNLSADFIEAPGTDRYAVICHGYHSSRRSMMAFAKKFYELGYGALLPDARGHGESEGDYVGMGWDERLDIADWIDWLVAREPEAEIVLFGISMGGATVMMTAGEPLPENVKAVIEDCGYSSIRAEFAFQLKQMFHLPAFPALNCASLVTRLRAGYSLLRDGDAAAQVARSDLPILFIHGGNDTFVPTEMVYAVYEAARGDKELLIVDGAAHGMASGVDPEAYWSAVTDFLSGRVG